MNFASDDLKLQEKWRSFWPQTGNPPNWDAVAKARIAGIDEWILVEAKANHPELCSQQCGAKDKSLKRILRALALTKKALGVHRCYRWEGTYYQYANRLACLYFLNEIAKRPAQLIFLYFVGDCFPDGRRCPATEQEWKTLIEACHLTLGIFGPHLLSNRVHDIFLSVKR